MDHFPSATSAQSTQASLYPLCGPMPASVPASASMAFMTSFPRSLPSPSSSPDIQGAKEEEEGDHAAALAMHDSLFTLPPFPCAPAFSIGTDKVSTPSLVALAPFAPSSMHAPSDRLGHASGHASPFQPHRSILLPHHHSAFGTHNLPPSPAPSESSAYTEPNDDYSSPTPSAALDPPPMDLDSIATALDLPAALTRLAQSAIESFSPAAAHKQRSSRQYSSSQITAGAIICSARVLHFNLSMCDTVKACGLSSVHQVRAVVEDMRRRSRTLVDWMAVEPESEDVMAPPPPSCAMAAKSAVPEFVGVEVPLSPCLPLGQVGSRPDLASPRRRAPRGPHRPSVSSPPGHSQSSAQSRTTSAFARLTPLMISTLDLPPHAHKHIEHVFRATKQQIKQLKPAGVKGGSCHDESILGGAIYFVGRRLKLYPVAQTKVAEAVKRTPTTVKTMYDRMCGMGLAVVPGSLRGVWDEGEAEGN